MLQFDPISVVLPYSLVAALSHFFVIQVFFNLQKQGKKHKRPRVRAHPTVPCYEKARKWVFKRLNNCRKLMKVKIGTHSNKLISVTILVLECTEFFSSVESLNDVYVTQTFIHFTQTFIDLIQRCASCNMHPTRCPLIKEA